MNHEKAAQLFSEWEALCKADGGALWGVNLHTPFVFIERETRDAVANMPDREGIFTKQGSVYAGTFPEHLVIAASVTEFGGMGFSWRRADFSHRKVTRSILFPPGIL